MALRRALLRSAASGQLTADALLDAGERQRVADEPRPRQATRGAAAGLRARRAPADLPRACSLFCRPRSVQGGGNGACCGACSGDLAPSFAVAAPCLRAPVRTCWGGKDVQLRASARVALRLAGPCLCKDANVQGASGAALHTLQCARRLSLRTTLPSMAQGLRHRARRGWCLSARVRGARAARRSGRRAAGARMPRSARAARRSGRRAAGVRMPRSARRARRSDCQVWSGGAPCRSRPGWTSAEACAAPLYRRQSAETDSGAVQGVQVGCAVQERAISGTGRLSGKLPRSGPKAHVRALPRPQ